MSPNTTPTLRAALHMLNVEGDDESRILGARIWLNMSDAEKPTNKEDFSWLMSLRLQMDVRLSKESSTTADEFARMIEERIGEPSGNSGEFE